MKKTESRDGSLERLVVTGMIVDVKLLGRVLNKWPRDGLFGSRWGNLIGGWCIDYFQQYRTAPGRNIRSIFNEWATKAKDDETIEIVESFLHGLSAEYEQGLEIDSAYLLDIAGKHFNKCGLKRLSEGIGYDLETGRLDQATQRYSEYRSVDLGVGQCLSLLEDQDAIRDAFTNRATPLIEYPGALGRFWGTSLCRDGFIALMGPEKRGKSFWLLDLAWQALKQSRRVAYFEVGDLGQDSTIQRFMMRAARRPLESSLVKIPTYIENVSGDPFASVDFKEFNLKALHWQRAVEASMMVTKKHGRNLLRMSCHPNSTISVAGIETILKEWEHADQWVPEVVVIDYADILAPMSPKDDVREQNNKTWKALRSLSLRIHCLVATATQTDAASYKTTTMDMSNFSEDKRKLAHVTGMVGLNAGPEEQKRGVMRLNWIVRRENSFDREKCVHVAGCLAIASPAMKSTF